MTSSDSDYEHRHKKSKRRRSRSPSPRSSRHHRSSRRSRDRSVDRSKSSREGGRRRSRDRQRESDRHTSRSRRESTKHRRRSRSSRSSSSRSCASKSRRKSSSKSDAIARNKERVQKALKAVVSSDDTLKINQKKVEISIEDQMKRSAAIEEIESAGFAQTEFKSSRGEIPLPKGNQQDVAHSAAMFATKTTPQVMKVNRIVDPNSPFYLFHHSLAVTVESKMDKWKIKLQTLRDKQTKKRFS